MVPISGRVITLNEEDNIGRLLESLKHFPEVVILDSGSKDSTIEIAEKFENTKVYYRKFDNYVSQKNHCISLSNNDWVLALDADECITEKFYNELKTLPEDYWKLFSGFKIPRLSYYLGRWINHCGWYPNYQLRLFNKQNGKFHGELVHETVTVHGNIHNLNSPILHFSYRDISHHIQFINKYSSLYAEEKFNKGKTSGVIFSILNAVYKFFFMYFVKLGFLDGREGLIISVLGGYYNFLKYIKIYELQKNSSDGKKLKSTFRIRNKVQ